MRLLGVSVEADSDIRWVDVQELYKERCDRHSSGRMPVGSARWQRKGPFHSVYALVLGTDPCDTWTGRSEGTSSAVS